MVDKAKLIVEGNSKEQVAYMLMKEIAVRENLYDQFDRKAYLDLYTECLEATSNQRVL